MNQSNIKVYQDKLNVIKNINEDIQDKLQDYEVNLFHIYANVENNFKINTNKLNKLLEEVELIENKNKDLSNTIEDIKNKQKFQFDLEDRLATLETDIKLLENKFKEDNLDNNKINEMNNNFIEIKNNFQKNKVDFNIENNNYKKSWNF